MRPVVTASICGFAMAIVFACGDGAREVANAAAGLGEETAEGSVQGRPAGRTPRGGDDDAGSVAPTFSTLLGGTAWDRIQSVWVDGAGDILVCGSTRSRRFPTTPGAYDETHNGSRANDAWIAKLSADGRRLLWATYLGGRQRDDCYGVMSDGAGNVYVIGWTASRDFPTTRRAYDRRHNGAQDIFVAKLDPGGSRLLYSTLIGGSGKDQCRGSMAVDDTGVVYFAGYTDSTDFPTTAGALQDSFQGGYGDALIGRLSADGRALDYATYLGSSGPDNAFAGVHLHRDGSLSVVGLAGAADFPVTAGSYQESYGGGGGGTPPWYGDAFATRMTLGAGEATVHFTTFLGGSGNDLPIGQHAMTGDRDGTYLFLSTSSRDLPTSEGAYQTALAGKASLYVAKIGYDGTALVSGTYIGGRVGGYEPSGIAVGPSGRLLLGGSIFGATRRHPVTADAAQRRAGGGDEGFFLVLSAEMSSLDYSTFVGGSAGDRVRDLAVGPEGRVVIAGDTWSKDFPLTAGGLQRRHAGEADSYVMAWDSLPGTKSAASAPPEEPLQRGPSREDVGGG